MASKLVLRNSLLSLAALALGALGFGFAAPAAAAEAGAAQVDVDLLNLRAGPGFQHLVLRLLERDQELTLLGRSRNGVWVEVRLPEGNGGWVYAAFLRTQVALSKLPVTEAAGGPTDPAAPQTTTRAAAAAAPAAPPSVARSGLARRALRRIVLAFSGSPFT